MTQAEELARLTDSQPVPPSVLEPGRVICAWCPDFDPALSRGATHGMCPACQARMRALNPTTRLQDLV